MSFARTHSLVVAYLQFVFPGLVCVSPTSADELLKEGDRIVFIGDSNTFAGTFVSAFDALARTNGKSFDVINVGLPSETCCGLSEPDHPFPRPTVQERIDRVLEKAKPDVVVACYGMNDGIYHPFSEERFKTYQQGILEFIGKVKKSGAKLILLTPPPFDPLPMKKSGKLVDKNSKKFAWFQIYEDYDSVLEKYSEWIMTLGPKVDVVIDIRSPIVSFVEEKRKSNPNFTMSGDGVHFNAVCHRLITQKIAKRILPGADKKTDPKIFDLADKKMKLLRDAWLTHTGHKRPGVKKGLPLDQASLQAKEINTQIERLQGQQSK